MGQAGFKLRSDSRSACRENRLKHKHTKEAKTAKSRKGWDVERAERGRGDSAQRVRRPWSLAGCAWSGSAPWTGGEQPGRTLLARPALGLESC